MVSTAAKHANDAMKRIEKFKKLLEVQESLGGTVDLVSPTRELLKEGKMVKISARSGDHQDRYIFLVSYFDISSTDGNGYLKEFGLEFGSEIQMTFSKELYY